MQNMPYSLNVSVQKEQRIKMNPMRKAIALRLKKSQNTAITLTVFNEIDMSEVIKMRKEYQERFQGKHGIRLGFMSFFVKAAVYALKDVPILNSEIEGDDIIYKHYYNIGVAVGIEKGLVVPVLKNVDILSFAEIEKEIAAFSNKAKTGKLTTFDMLNATFSITNAGTYGSLLATPIINPPQSAIMGMHNIILRPIAIQGEIVTRPMMYISLSYDHRIVEEKDAVIFLSYVKQKIEYPKSLLFNL